MASVYLKCRLCNNLHQIAVAYAHSLLMDEPCFITGRARFFSTDWFPNWDKRITIGLWQKPKYSKIFTDGQHTTWRNPVKLPPHEKNLLFYGQFESSQYFRGFEAEIKKLYFCEVKPQNVTAIHIRLTDILRPGAEHITLPVSYYWEAMSCIGAKKYVICSDDIPQCKKWFGGSRFEFREGTSGYEDWLFLRGCENLIMSNSTFSWWAAYLGMADKIICPSRWLKCPDDSFKFEPNWRILDVRPERNEKGCWDSDSWRGRSIPFLG